MQTYENSLNQALKTLPQSKLINQGVEAAEKEIRGLAESTARHFRCNALNIQIYEKLPDNEKKQEVNKFFLELVDGQSLINFLVGSRSLIHHRLEHEIPEYEPYIQDIQKLKITSLDHKVVEHEHLEGMQQLEGTVLMRNKTNISSIHRIVFKTTLENLDRPISMLEKRIALDFFETFAIYEDDRRGQVKLSEANWKFKGFSENTDLKMEILEVYGSEGNSLIWSADMRHLNDREDLKVMDKHLRDLNKAIAIFYAEEEKIKQKAVKNSVIYRFKSWLGF